MKNKFNMREISKLTNLPSSTIRYYDQLNLLIEVGRDENNYREFNDLHVKCLNVFKHLRDSGMSIEKIIEIHQLYLNDQMTKEEVYKIIDNHKKELQKEIELLKEQEKQIEHFANLI